MNKNAEIKVSETFLCVASVLMLLSACTSAMSDSSKAQTPAIGAVDSKAREHGCRSSECVVFDLYLDKAKTIERWLFTWTAVNDSRCPLGDNCFSEGKVQVSLTVRTEDGITELLELTLGPGTSNAESATFSGANVQLISVEPVPLSGVSIAREAYVATVAIER